MKKLLFSHPIIIFHPESTTCPRIAGREARFWQHRRQCARPLLRDPIVTAMDSNLEIVLVDFEGISIIILINFLELHDHSASLATNVYVPDSSCGPRFWFPRRYAHRKSRWRWRPLGWEIIWSEPWCTVWPVNHLSPEASLVTVVFNALECLIKSFYDSMITKVWDFLCGDTPAWGINSRWNVVRFLHEVCEEQHEDGHDFVTTGRKTLKKGCLQNLPSQRLLPSTPVFNVYKLSESLDHVESYYGCLHQVPSFQFLIR